MYAFWLLLLVACERAGEAPVPEPSPPPGPTKLVVADAAVPDVPLDGTPDAATARLDELAEIVDILTPGKGGHYDAARLAMPNHAIDPAWDPKRVWLTEIRQDGTAFAIAGKATTTEDIVQFMKRLAASQAFADIVIKTTERDQDEYRFDLVMKAPAADARKTRIFDKRTWKRP